MDLNNRSKANNKPSLGQSRSRFVKGDIKGLKKGNGPVKKGGINYAKLYKGKNPKDLKRPSAHFHDNLVKPEHQVVIKNTKRIKVNWYESIEDCFKKKISLYNACKRLTVREKSDQESTAYYKHFKFKREFPNTVQDALNFINFENFSEKNSYGNPQSSAGASKQTPVNFFTQRNLNLEFIQGLLSDKNLAIFSGPGNSEESIFWADWLGHQIIYIVSKRVALAKDQILLTDTGYQQKIWVRNHLLSMDHLLNEICYRAYIRYELGKRSLVTQFKENDSNISLPIVLSIGRIGIAPKNKDFSVMTVEFTDGWDS